MKHTFFRVLIIILFATPSHAATVTLQTFDEFLPIGKKAWAAYECSELAKISSNQGEAARLFVLGSEVGRDFFERTKDLQPQGNEIGDSVSLRLATISGPTMDFKLGRLYQSADDALTNVMIRGNKSYTQRALSLFSEKNCAYLK